MPEVEAARSILLVKPKAKTGEPEDWPISETPEAENLSG